MFDSNNKILLEKDGDAIRNERKCSIAWIVEYMNRIDVERQRVLKFGHIEYAERSAGINRILTHILRKVQKANDVSIIEEQDENVSLLLRIYLLMSEEFRKLYMKQPERHDELFLYFDQELTLENILGPA